MGKIARSEEGMLSPILLDGPQEEVASQEFPVGRELLAAIPLGSGNDCTVGRREPSHRSSGIRPQEEVASQEFPIGTEVVLASVSPRPLGRASAEPRAAVASQTLPRSRRDSRNPVRRT